MLDMLEFLRDEGVSPDILAEVKKFCDTYPEADPVLQRRIPGPLQIAEKIPQVQIVFVHRPLGVGLDGLMIRQEIQQNLALQRQMRSFMT